MTVNLTQEFDAQVWVSEWMKAIKNDRSIPTSEGTMLVWFANAIMAGYDKARAERDEWRADAERFIQLANFNNKKASEYFELHEQLVEKYGGENNQADVFNGGENNES